MMSIDPGAPWDAGRDEEPTPELFTPPPLLAMAADAVADTSGPSGTLRRSLLLDAGTFASIRQAAPRAAERIVQAASAAGRLAGPMFGPGLLTVDLAVRDLTPRVCGWLRLCSDCKTLRLKGAQAWSSESLAEVLAALELTSLDVDGTHDATISMELARALSAMPRLRTLDLGGTPLAEGAADSVTESAPHGLHAFRLRFSDVRGEAVASLCHRAPALEALDLAGSKALMWLPALPGGLLHLELQGCTSLEPGRWAGAIGDMLRSGRCRSLGLAETGVSNEDLGVWATDLAAGGSRQRSGSWASGSIHSACSGSAAAGRVSPPTTAGGAPTAAAAHGAAAGPPAIEYLDLSWNEGLTGPPIVSFLAPCSGLTALRLRNVGDVGGTMLKDDDVRAIAASCPRLERLAITRCDDVGDGAAEALSGLAGLVRLDLAWSQALSDRGLQMLMMGAARLRWLGLEGCKMLTAEGLLAIRSYPRCQDLQQLSLAWVNAAGSHEASALRTALPACTVVDYYGMECDD